MPVVSSAPHRARIAAPSHAQHPQPLAIQAYLRSGKTLDDLTSEFAIRVVRHPDPATPLVALKYNQIDSPKTHPIVRDCRGIVLELDTWNVVALPFRRFFNAGEDAENFAQFDWSDFTTMTKEDGSLILVYHYQNQWHVNTSGSFGYGECGFSKQNWHNLFWAASGIDRSVLIPEWTYVFEMWTPHNKVIRTYDKPSTFLLSVFDPGTLTELPIGQADYEAELLGVPRPEHHHFHSMDEITRFLKHKEATDKTYEGVVIRDRNNERYKIKSATYLALHHMVDNGNLFNPKRLVPLVLAGEIDEVIAYMPEMRETIQNVKGELDQAYTGLIDIWRSVYGVATQREFAQAIIGKNPFGTILFTVRKKLGGAIESPAAGEPLIREAWEASAELIVKVLYGR